MNIPTHFILCLIVEFATAQFTSSRRQSKTPCELRGTGLVEQFFNVIFAEFQHSPPTCTCVQMCADQPTYCYPNGCFRKEKKKDSSPVSSIQQDTKTVFLVDDKNEVLEDLMENMNLMAPASAGTADRSYHRPWASNSMGRNYPLKEIVFKYKRLPKLQMKYNLREQIKHARDKKAEVDLSKTRWPTNKQINRQINNQRSSNYLMSMYPETNQQESPKYFQRYLTKRENQVGLDISALYLYKDASNFSLETLIDNLIERSLQGVNSTSTLKLSNSSKVKDEDNNGDSRMNSIIEDQNNTNEIALTISLVANGSNKDQQNNSNTTNSTTASYFEMITMLSNEIEKQNNITLEVIGNLTGNSYNVISDPKSANLSNSNETEDGIKTILKVSDEIIKSTTNKAPTSLHFIPVINSQVKKSKQRIVRKLRNRKLN